MKVRAEPDERLLIEAAQRDPRRFIDLYENNFDRVYAYVSLRVRDRSEAQDLTSEVFHHALENLARFEWRGVPFAAWLLRIAANATTDRWQRAVQEGSQPSDASDKAAADDIERRTLLVQLVSGSAPDQQRSRRALSRREEHSRHRPGTWAQRERGEATPVPRTYQSADASQSHPQAECAGKNEGPCLGH